MALALTRHRRAVLAPVLDPMDRVRQSGTVVSTVLAVDGNSLIHRAFHSQAGTGLRTLDGRPMWAVRGLVGQLLEAVDRLQPDCVVVGFDDPDVSIRRNRWPHYKAQRADKLESLISQLLLAREVLEQLGVVVAVPPGLEADDVLAAVAGLAVRDGFRAVLMTSDRDAFALIDETTSVLRILSGGVESSPLLTPERLQLMLGIRPHQYRDYAALRGDASDNLPGVPGIGPKTAAALLIALGSATAAFDDVVAGGESVRRAVGRSAAARLADPAARAAWEHNCEVMAPQLGVELPRLTSSLPLASATVRSTCALLDMPAVLPRALRVLAGEEVSAGPDRLAWSSRRAEPTRLADRGRQRFPPLPRKPILLEQPALFSL